MIKKSLIALAVGTALISGAVFAKDHAPAADDSIMVMFKPGVTKQQRESLVRSTGASLRQLDAQGRDIAFKHVADGRIAKIRVPKGVNKDFLIKQLARNPAIEVAEPNFLVKTTRAAVTPPNDPRFGELWGLHNTGQAGGVAGADIKALEAWRTTTGDHSVIIGVIDTGMDYNHPDLIANRWENSGNLPGHQFGYSALNTSRDPMDTDTHGTHVAGTIGAAGDNATGVVGVSWNVTLLPCSFLGPQGGSTAGAIECIDYYTNLKTNHGVDIKATNNSWGGGGFSETLRAAIQSGGDAGILFIAAAGNDARNADNSPMYPAAYDLDVIVSVASTDRNDNMSGFSNFGSTSVDLGAPGSAILSTVPNNGYAAYSGTSMASPHVAGAAALLWSVNPDITPLEMKEILMETGDSLPALEGKTVSGKRLNVARALEEANPDPGFRLALSPRAQNIVAGDTASFTLDISSVADWMQLVNLSLDAPAALSGASLSVNSAMPGDVVVLTVNTDTATAWGDYTLAITATDSSGELERTVNASLNITPAFLQDYSYINDTPVAIPDNSPAGITSTISVPDNGTVFNASVDLNITHTWRGDLIVKLTSPTGTQHTLHNATGGSAQNLIGNYPITSFNGEQMTGDWVLLVSDNARLDTGILNSWSLNLSALNDDVSPVDPIAPVASFSYSVSGFTASFTDLSTDEDDNIIAWNWRFGDNNSSTAQNPVHTFAAAGAYTVILSVTDESGLTSTSTQVVSIADVSADFNLNLSRATRARTGSTIVDLRMNDVGQAVDVYRDGALVDTVSGNRYRDRFNSTAATATYKLCLAGTQVCSAELVVSF